MKLIVGLGNPGDKYFGTRHNLGFALVEEYAHKHNLGEWKGIKKFKSEVIKVSDELILARPQTYMNLSGGAVQSLASFYNGGPFRPDVSSSAYKIAPEDIIVIHDELDLPLGKIKVRLGGAAAGHHGVESIIEKLRTDKFARIRMGIGNSKTKESEHHREHISVESFVVEPFSEHERSDVKHMIKQGLKALEILVDEGLGKAQQQYN